MKQRARLIAVLILFALLVSTGLAWVQLQRRDGLVSQIKSIERRSVTKVTDSTFRHEVLDSTTPVMVVFHAPWCQLCHALMPTLELISNRFEGKVKFVTVDCDANEFSRQKYAIKRYPTLIVFDQGEALKETSGLLSPTETESWLREELYGP